MVTACGGFRSAGVGLLWESSIFQDSSLPSTGDATGTNPGMKHVRPMKRLAQAGSLLVVGGHTMGLHCPDPHHDDSPAPRYETPQLRASTEQNNLSFLISEFSLSTGSLPRLGYGLHPTTSLLQGVGDSDITHTPRTSFSWDLQVWSCLSQKEKGFNGLLLPLNSWRGSPYWCSLPTAPCGMQPSPRMALQP